MRKRTAPDMLLNIVVVVAIVGVRVLLQAVVLPCLGVGI